MSRTCITLQTETLDELKKLLGARSKTEAVTVAIRDQIRSRKIEGIKKMAGKMEFIKNAKDLRHEDKRIG